MAFTAQDVIDRVRDLVQDTDANRWTDPEMLRWINDGLSATIAINPPAFAERVDLDIVAGAYQQLGPTHYRLLRILAGVTLVDRDRLDAIDPGWEGSAQSDILFHYTYDEKNPREFYVYPPASANVVIQAASVAVHPDEIVTTAQDIPIDPMYLPVMVDYLLFRAYSKHSKAQGNDQRSQAAYARYAQALGVKINTILAMSPNNEQVPT